LRRLHSHGVSENGRLLHPDLSVLPGGERVSFV
jgi:hypothetical protein